MATERKPPLSVSEFSFGATASNETARNRPDGCSV